MAVHVLGIACASSWLTERHDRDCLAQGHGRANTSWIILWTMGRPTALEHGMTLHEELHATLRAWKRELPPPWTFTNLWEGFLWEGLSGSRSVRRVA